MAAHLPKELVARLRAQDPAKGSASGDKDKDDPRDQDECIEKLIRGSSAGDISYRYDAAGNRLEESLGGRVIASTFSPANEMLTRGTMRFSYDPRGNQTEKVYASGRREVFGYSAANKLASYSTGRVGDSKLKEVQRYLYEPDGGRVLVEDVQGGQLQHALWDGARPIEEFVTKPDGRGTKDKGTLYTRGLGGDLLDQARYTRRAPKTLHGLEDEDVDDWDDRAEWKRGGPDFKLGHVRFISPDFLGSTALVTNHHGKVLDRLTYGPWGENFEGDRNKTAFGYTGHRWDSSTGHWMALHRFLDPRAGRWSQRDPGGGIDGGNRYAYVGAKPLSSVDANGLFGVPYAYDSNIRFDPTASSGIIGAITVQANFRWQIVPRGMSASKYYAFIQITKVVEDGVVSSEGIRNAGWFDSGTGFAIDTDDMSEPIYGDPGAGQGGWRKEDIILDDHAAGFVRHRFSPPGVPSLPGKYVFEAESYLVSSCDSMVSSSVDVIDGWEWGYEFNKSWWTNNKDVKKTRFNRLHGLTPIFNSAFSKYLSVSPWKGAPLIPRFR